MDSQSAGCFLIVPPLFGCGLLFIGAFSHHTSGLLYGAFSGILLSRCGSYAGRWRRCMRGIDQLSAELRRIPEKIESVHLNSLGQWDMMERSVMSSLHVMDQNVSRQAYHSGAGAYVECRIVEKTP